MQRRQLRMLFSLILGQWQKYLGAALSVSVSVALGLLTPMLLANVIDSVIGDLPFALPTALTNLIASIGGRTFLAQNLWLPALLLLSFSVIGGAFQYLRGRLTAIASENVAQTLRDDLYAHIQTLPYNYHVKAMTGDLIQRCISDVDTIRQFLGNQLIEIIRTVLLVALALWFMLQINAQMTLISMALVPPLFLGALLFFRWVQRLFKRADETEGRLSAVLQENLAAVRVVRAFGRQQFEVEKFERVNIELHKKTISLVNLLTYYWSSADLLSMLQICATLATGVYMAAAGRISLGALTQFVSYTSMLLWPVRQLGRILSDFGKSLVSVGRLQEILYEKSESESSDAQDAPIDADIEFRDVHFDYDGHPVLNGVSFVAKRGQTVAILGATGSGKSTMMHLLQRLYEVKRGQILIGGIDIHNIRKHHLRSRVGLILQEPFLYSRTVGANIGIAADNLTEAQLEDAARAACADDFIRSFDNGYETIVGERGVTLSGGQMQRVAIARTLLKNNDVLIFDDSLSAVDTQTDALIREQLRTRRAGVTTFIISHRLTTLMDADLILVLKDGRIAQSGTHAELLLQEGLYKDIYNIQAALEEELQDDVG